MKQWQCRTCGYVYVANLPPPACPHCQSGQDRFIEKEKESESTEEIH